MDHKYRAAQALASYISHPTVDMILPSPLDKKVAQVIAAIFSLQS